MQLSEYVKTLHAGVQDLNQRLRGKEELLAARVTEGRELAELLASLERKLTPVSKRGQCQCTCGIF